MSEMQSIKTFPHICPPDGRPCAICRWLDERKFVSESERPCGRVGESSALGGTPDSNRIPAVTSSAAHGYEEVYSEQYQRLVWRRKANGGPVNRDSAATVGTLHSRSVGEP